MGRLRNKATFKIFGRRYFILVLIGSDERTKNAKLNPDRRALSPSVIRAFLFGSILLWTVFSVLVLTFLAAYLAKSYMGIDLVQGWSPVGLFLNKIRLCHPNEGF